MDLFKGLGGSALNTTVQRTLESIKYDIVCMNNSLDRSKGIKKLRDIRRSNVSMEIRRRVLNNLSKIAKHVQAELGSGDRQLIHFRKLEKEANKNGTNECDLAEHESEDKIEQLARENSEEPGYIEINVEKSAKIECDLCVTRAHEIDLSASEEEGEDGESDCIEKEGLNDSSSAISPKPICDFGISQNQQSATKIDTSASGDKEEVEKPGASEKFDDLGITPNQQSAAKNNLSTSGKEGKVEVSEHNNAVSDTSPKTECSLGVTPNQQSTIKINLSDSGEDGKVEEPEPAVEKYVIQKHKSNQCGSGKEVEDENPDHNELAAENSIAQ